MLTRLGEELITDNTQALLELIKNAYDADATLVRINIDTTVETKIPPREFEGDDSPPTSAEDDADEPQEEGPSKDQGNSNDGQINHPVVLKGRITIADTGHGLDADAIERGWLTLSASPKRAMKRAGRDTVGGRTPLGDKGLGRLGAQRLGDVLRLRTRPTRPSGTVPKDRADKAAWPDIEHLVEFRFSDFSPDLLLDAVEVTWTTRELTAAANGASDWPVSTPWGTVIEIVGLTEPERWRETAHLSNELSTVINPFEGISRFSIGVKVDGVAIDLERVGADVRKAAMTRWRANFDGEVLTIEGDLRPQHFRPRDKDVRAALETLLREDDGARFNTFLQSVPALTPYHPRPGKQPYLTSFRRRVEVATLGAPEGMETFWWRKHACGPFALEIDSVSLQFGVMRDATMSIFDTQKEYREWMKARAGVDVYRDGFRVAGGDDLFELGKAFSSGGSFYSLRPANVLGYVAITAKHNPALEETTDREGLRNTPPSRTFIELLHIVRNEINKALDDSGRAAGDFVTANQRASEDTVGEADMLSARADAALAQAQSASRSLDLVLVDVKAAADSQLLREHEPELQQRMAAAQVTLSAAARELESLAGIRQTVEALRSDALAMRERLDETYQLIGLGLVAEAAAHELGHTVQRLSERSSEIRGVVAKMTDRDVELEVFIEEVAGVARSLRTQLRHLDPQLRYARDKRQVLKLDELVRDTFEYHRERLRGTPFKISVEARDPATLTLSPGRITQVIDNLVLNAEYWVSQSLQRGETSHGSISASIEGARLTITDNGPGVDPELAQAIFEPFVSGKAGGRGLGLFICRQLLDAEEATIRLVPRTDGPSRAFEVDLTARRAETT